MAELVRQSVDHFLAKAPLEKEAQWDLFGINSILPPDCQKIVKKWKHG